MATVRHLRNAPITEAIVDFRVSLPSDFDPPSLLAARELLRTDYPHAEERQGFEAFFEFTGLKPAAGATKNLGLQGLWLKSRDERTIGQFRVDGFTFNRLRPYTSWEEILLEAMRLWRVYRDIVRPDSVTRLALRYINNLKLSGPGIDLDAYMLTAPKLPRAVPQIVSAFASRVVLEDPERSLMANVAQILETDLDVTARSLLFDIDVYRVGALDVQDEVLSRTLEDVRAYKNNIFFGSLTEQFVEFFA